MSTVGYTTGGFDFSTSTTTKTTATSAATTVEATTTTTTAATAAPAAAAAAVSTTIAERGRTSSTGADPPIQDGTTTAGMDHFSGTSFTSRRPTSEKENTNDSTETTLPLNSISLDSAGILRQTTGDPFIHLSHRKSRLNPFIIITGEATVGIWLIGIRSWADTQNV